MTREQAARWLAVRGGPHDPSEDDDYERAYLALGATEASDDIGDEPIKQPSSNHQAITNPSVPTCFKDALDRIAKLETVIEPAKMMRKQLQHFSSCRCIRCDAARAFDVAIAAIEVPK